MEKMQVGSIEIERAICRDPPVAGEQQRIIGHNLAYQFTNGAGWYQELGISPFLQSANSHGLPGRGSEDLQRFFKVGHGVNQIYITINERAYEHTIKRTFDSGPANTRYSTTKLAISLACMKD